MLFFVTGDRWEGDDQLVASAVQCSSPLSATPHCAHILDCIELYGFIHRGVIVCSLETSLWTIKTYLLVNGLFLGQMAKY